MINYIKRLNNISLRYRLIIAVVLCILLPWAMTYVVSNYFTKDVLEKRAVKQSEDSLRMIEMSLINSLDELMYISNFVQFDTEFNKLLKSYQLIDQDSPNVSQKIALHNIKITNYLEGVTDLLGPSYITILLNDELYYMNYPASEYDPLTFYNEPWFDGLSELTFYETYWIGTHPTYIQSDVDSEPYLSSIGRSIKQSNQVQANVIISFHESDISNIFRNFSNEMEQKFYLTDKDGVIFSSVVTDEIGEELTYDLSKDKSYQIVEYNDTNHLLVTYPVAYNDWKLVSLVPYKKTIGNINLVTRTTIIIQGTFLLLFLIALIVLIRETTKPLTRLSHVTREVEKGNLQVRADVIGNNDVAKLGQSFDLMLDTIENKIKEIKIQEEGKRSAELEMLQAQINPHFLFNVLNAIRLNISMNGDKDSAKLIQSLSSLLRMTINRNNAFISLQEEIDIIQHYVKLMNFRHGHYVVLELEIEPNAGKEEVPRFFLQPVIENAITHGYNEIKGKVTISAVLDKANNLTIKVSDNGPGMNQEIMQEVEARFFESASDSSKNHYSFNGIGLQNVYQRMRIIYGEAFQMKLSSQLGRGTVYTFHIPRK
ncbi:cache domain-containing sensor histidine kinase [Salipaludibacillus sp. CF4.18]|uniref:cache domain-containing sensor histidine kinase n=1 Tax=Salipaludibacillus sp. CF4.18 TaxID=3373081 RepID=UPI003EE77E64